jgi:hypothetical protein
MSRILARVALALALSLAVGAALGTASLASADEPLALGFGLHGGANMTTQKWQPIDYGALLGGSLSLESRYFLTPVFTVHHAWLASEHANTDVGAPLGVVSVESSLHALGFLLGPAVDLGPVRITASAGLYWLTVASAVEGARMDSATLVFGYSLAVEGCFYRWEWGRVGAFVTANFLAEAQIAYLTGGLAMRFEVRLAPHAPAASSAPAAASLHP